MRADRLLALMMLLQSRGKMTARELATELEVSERTIYRDIDALSIAGVPVYADRGPGGGCGLLHDYRVRLTGLTDAEVQAFFMLRIPATLAALGADQEAQSALLKIAAALAGDYRHDEARIRQRILMDPTPWFQSATPVVPALQTLYQALWTDRKVRLRYQMSFDAIGERSVAPYGLVAKGDQWHLVYGWQMRSHILSVDEVREVQILDDLCDRPVDFDLKEAWQQWLATLESNQPEYLATLLVDANILGTVTRQLGINASACLAHSESPCADDRVSLTAPFRSFAEARTSILGWGQAVEVLAPRALRLSVADFAAQIVALYTED